MSPEAPKMQAERRGHGWLFRTVIKLVIVVAAVGILVGIGAMPAPNRQTPAQETPPVNVVVMDVAAEQAFADTITLPAVVEPNRVVTVSAEVSARVERILPKEGDLIQAGDLLVQLNEDLIRPQFLMAEAQYKRDKIEFDRMAALVEADATPRQDLDNATVQLAASEATLAEVRARLDRTHIVAPAGGVLNNLLVEEGEYVQAGTPVAEVVETRTIKVVVAVPERDIAFFDVGQEAGVLLNSRGADSNTKGTISYINRLADSQTRSTIMEITLDNRDGHLRSGQIVRVVLTRGVLDDVIFIPLLAVLPQEEGYAVYVVKDSTAERRDIEIGIIKGDRVHVKQGLVPGESLIIGGHRLVAPGQTVNVVSGNR